MQFDHTILNNNGKINSVFEILRQSQEQIECIGINGSERAFIVSRLCREISGPVFIVMPDIKSCETFLEDLRFFAGRDAPEGILFPAYNILPFKRISYNNETAAQRIRILYQLAAGYDAPKIIVTPVEALLQLLIPKNALSDYAELLMTGEEIDRDRLIHRLHSGGYSHVTLVEEYGEYSVRGGIIDIYSPLYQDPLRIELFGDIVDSIRFFSPQTQRKVESISEAVILPAREAIFEKSQLMQTMQRVRELACESVITEKNAKEFIERLRHEGVFPGIESLLPLIYPKPDTLFDYVFENTLWIQFDPGELEKAAIYNEGRAAKNYINATHDQRLCVDPEKIYLKWVMVKEILRKKSRLAFRMLSSVRDKNKDSTPPLAIKFSVKDNNDISADLTREKKDEHILKPLAEWVKENQTIGLLTLLACNTALQANRLQTLLKPYGIDARIADDHVQHINKHRQGIFICTGALSAGFVWLDESLAIITEKEIFGPRLRRRRSKKTQRDIKTEFFDFGELNSGDLVVHIEHGVGVYKGLEKLKIEGVINDFLLIVYKDGDKLYLPVDRLDMVQKYMGVDGITPVVDKMGGKSWQRVRERAKKSVEKIAGELLALYASRKVIKGHAFGVSDNYFRDFEAGFPFEETPDQIKSIDDVICDMEDSSPMDRLICGDVGYGKTEIALRAAFKAVMDTKQVAVLVPTTLLAEQHFQTFSQRFERYPVNIDRLSRFRSRSRQREIVSKLKDGKIDIIIGTQRLLQKDINLKDLCQAVIDEEQRFGVKHKEKLKKMRKNVDVLSMTATPIPRTLHMSLLGVRDISVIQTPPELRRAIISYISEFDPIVITEAIKKELARKGQIFFVHNNINTIWNIAKYLKDLVPEVRLAVAHGRLSEDELEKAMVQFLNNEIDMLVCTTIVESGLDIPNANTIIINRADRFGLAQIYQLRGRVGRSDEQAYAYLFISKEAALTRDAEKRLKVLMEHSGLGAGFQIAMNDLKIRGGGAALGVSQSGHIAAVGYDMFLKLMEDSVSRLKGEPVVEALDPEINVPMSVFIPESYIFDADQRLLAYRRLAKMKGLKEISDFKEELIDRYGALPVEAGNLLLKIMLKILSIKAGVKKLDLRQGLLFLSFSEIHQKHPFGMLKLVDENPEQFLFTPDNGLKIKLVQNGLGQTIAQAKNILMEIAGYVNHSTF